MFIYAVASLTLHTVEDNTLFVGQSFTFKEKLYSSSLHKFKYSSNTNNKKVILSKKSYTLLRHKN